jgi:hypothetical protein
MFSLSNNHFWDSCTLIRYLTQVPADLIGDMSKMIDDAKAGKRKIWISTILFAEFRPSLLNSNSKFRTIEELISEMEGVLRPVTPNMEITLRAGRMRNHSFFRPDGIRQATEKERVLTVPDSIQLSTSLFVKEAMGIDDIEFHTFDDGRGKNYEEKAVSLLRFDDYSKHISGCEAVEAARKLVRIKPALQDPNLC